MKFQFTVGYKEIIKSINQYFIDYDLSIQIIKYDYKVNFVIKKFFSTTTLTFAVQGLEGGGVLFISTNEEIGWTHKGHVESIKENIKDMVQDLGGVTVST